MKKATLLLCGFVAACTTAPEPIMTKTNDRIIYADLTRPLISHAPETAKPSDVPQPQDGFIKASVGVNPVQPGNPVLDEQLETSDIVTIERETIQKTIRHFVNFANESAKLDAIEQSKLVKAADWLPKQYRFFVIGHSHGSSSVGVETLSQMRANAVADWLVDTGVDRGNIHTMSSWSKVDDEISPPKGVLVYLTPYEDADFQLLLTPYNEESTNEET